MADGHWQWTEQAPATYNSSYGVWRDFCPHCGSQMAYRNSRNSGEIHFYAASLDDPAAYAPTQHDFSEEMLPWVHLQDGLPRK